MFSCYVSIGFVVISPVLRGFSPGAQVFLVSKTTYLVRATSLSVGKVK